MRFGGPLGKRLTFVAAGVAAVLVIVTTIMIASKSQAFEAGQRWSCLTDQGEQAFLAVLNVDGEVVSFSWGTLKDDQNLFVLCNKRDQLSLQDIREFCKLLGSDYSSGHVRLNQACNR